MRRPVVAGVVGAPIAHSLSPTIHNAWIAASGLDAVYVAFAPAIERFPSLVEGFRGGVARGLNVTAPFKETALGLATFASERARAAGAANLLLFEPDGSVHADNTDGVGLLSAFASQAPDFDVEAGPVVVIGAGGAARGAATALLAAGAPLVRIVNRSRDRGAALVRKLGPACGYFTLDECGEAVADANAVINAAAADLIALGSLAQALAIAPKAAVVMDMIYRPPRTALLEHARALGLATVDGLAMLIGQAEPSFERIFHRPAPALDIRGLVLAGLREPK